jgi:RimJ/RimL family protein N-acetyltransferase
MSTIEFRRLTLEDGEQFSAFLGYCFGEGFFSRPELYKHWHFDNPAGESIIYGAFDADKLVGTNALQWMAFRINHEKYRLVHAVSAATNPAYRSIIIRNGQKLESIFTMLNMLSCKDAEQQGALLTHAFPNKHSLNGFTKYLKFDDVGTVPILIDVLRIAEIISLKCPWLPIHLSRLLTLVPQCSISSRKLFRLKPYIDIQTSQVEKIDEEWDQFANESAKYYPIIQERHTSFLRWRFLKSPILKYQLLEARKKGQLVGYLVYLVYPWPEREQHQILCGYIVDFLVFPNDEGKQALYNLLCHARRDFVLKNAVIATSIHNIPFFLHDVFFKAGFFTAPAVIAPRSMHFTIRKNFEKYLNNNTLLDTVTNLKKWFITLGDNDII